MARWACVKQHDQRDCGAAALATVVKQHGLDIGIARVREIAGTDRIGTSLAGLREGAERLGLLAKGVKGPVSALEKIPLPAIAHIVKEIAGEKMGHFVVLHRVKDGKVLLADPGDGILTETLEEFAKRWTGHLLLCAPTPDLQKVKGKEGSFRRFFGLLRPTFGLTMEAFLCTVLYTLLGFGSSFYVQFLVDEVLVHHETRVLNLISLGMVLLVLLKTLFSTLRQYFLMHVGQNVDLTLISTYYRHILTLPMRFFDTRKTGEILSRVNDAVKIRHAVSGVTLSAVVDFILVLLSLALMFYYEWHLALVSTLLLPLFGLVFLLHYGPTGRVQRKIMEQAAELESFLVEDIEGVATIKVFGAERRRQMLTESALVRLIRAVFASGKLSLSAANLSALFSGAGSIAILWWGAHLVIDGALTPGQLLFFYTLLGFMVGPVERLSGLYVTIQDAVIAMDRLGDILDLETEKSWDTGAKVEWPGLKKGIEFRGVTFSYGSRGTVLNGVDCSIPAGKTVALVGESGSGKTTFCGLLARYHDPTAGSVSVDGFDLRDVRLGSLRARLGIVPQDPHLFHGTVRENIALGRPDASLEQIMAAAQAAQIHEFVVSQPQRYETQVGERGMNLSGGQRQRLAIARAILQDPDLLIFDEATSHLDTESERAIQASLKGILAGRTCVIVAHRLSTIRNADLILVFLEGKIAEQGSHDDLLEKKGIYQRLWSNQMDIDMERRA